MPKISVIIPVYKVEEYLNRCVDSVINQTYKDFEIILVDDGSPDNCGKICDEYAARYSFVTVIHKENGGLSDARNAGLDVMRGEYVAFVDSDDYIHPEYLNILITEAEKHNADISLIGFKRVPDDIDSFEKIVDYETEVLNSHQAMCIFFLPKKKYQFVFSCAKIYKREVFLNLRFPLGTIHEDLYTTWKCFLAAKTIVSSSPKLYYYRLRSDSIMNSLQKLESIKIHIDAFKEMLEYFLNRDKDLVLLAAYRLMKNYDLVIHFISEKENGGISLEEVKAHIKALEKKKLVDKKLFKTEFEAAFLLAHPIRAQLYFYKVALLKKLHLKKEDINDT